jgi:hypothetical protein
VYGWTDGKTEPFYMKKCDAFLNGRYMCRVLRNWSGGKTVVVVVVVVVVSNELVLSKP